MAPRPDVSEERKSQILEAATAVFARLGFQKASMDDVARASGVSKGLLYWYFKSKDEIIAAILRRMFAHQMESLQALLTTDAPASERLLLFTRDIAAEFKGMFALLPLAYEFYAVAARQESVRQFFKEYFASFRKVTSELVRQGIERGEFRDVDAEETAIFIAALYEGLALLWMVDPAAIDWDTMGESPVRLLLDGLRRR